MCRFCEKYSLMQKVDLYSEVTFKFSASAGLDEHTLLDNGFCGRTVYSMKNGIGFSLNYCPECGRKLAKQ